MCITPVHVGAGIYIHIRASAALGCAQTANEYHYLQRKLIPIIIITMNDEANHDNG